MPETRSARTHCPATARRHRYGDQLHRRRPRGTSFRTPTHPGRVLGPAACLIRSEGEQPVPPIGQFEWTQYAAHGPGAEVLGQAASCAGAGAGGGQGGGLPCPDRRGGHGRRPDPFRWRGALRDSTASVIAHSPARRRGPRRSHPATIRRAARRVENRLRLFFGSSHTHGLLAEHPRIDDWRVAVCTPRPAPPCDQSDV
jgi:hypothetical protein